VNTKDSKFFNRVFDSITDPLAIYDRDLRILMVNQALVILYRRTASEMVGLHCYEVFHGRSTSVM
jgi:PAS domain-containing protein